HCQRFSTPIASREIGDIGRPDGRWVHQAGSLNMQRRISFLMAAGAATALTVGGARGAGGEGARGGPVSGGGATFGGRGERGAEVAVKDINAAGGLLGKKLKLEIGDDQCEPKQALPVANSFVQKKVIFVAGHYCSGVSIPASAVYAENNIMQITPASTNPRLT